MTRGATVKRAGTLDSEVTEQNRTCNMALSSTSYQAPGTQLAAANVRAASARGAGGEAKTECSCMNIDDWDDTIYVINACNLCKYLICI